MRDVLAINADQLVTATDRLLVGGIRKVSHRSAHLRMLLQPLPIASPRRYPRAECTMVIPSRRPRRRRIRQLAFALAVPALASLGLAAAALF